MAYSLLRDEAVTPPEMAMANRSELEMEAVLGGAATFELSGGRPQS